MKKLQEYSISYADAISFSVMDAAGCAEALSYDRHFHIAGF
jgi:predicted nucleic acid-binding protein